MRVALDGDQAIQIMSGRDFRTDAVILDLNLPKLSGFSILQTYPANRAGGGVYVQLKPARPRAFAGARSTGIRTETE